MADQDAAWVMSRGPGAGPVLQGKFRAAAAVLRARFEAMKQGGKHAGERGLRIEQVLIEFLREHLPPRYGVARGEVVDSRGRVSRQCDVVVYDALHAPMLLSNEISRVFPAECVFAVIEVKSNLARDALAKAVEVVVGVKELDRSAVVAQHGGHRMLHGIVANPVPFGAVFALSGMDMQRTLVPALDEFQGHVRPVLRVDCVCVLDAALAYYFAPPAEGRSWVPSVATEKTRLGYYASGEDTLLMFYLFLMHQLAMRELFPPDLLRYAAGFQPPEQFVYLGESNT